MHGGNGHLGAPALVAAECLLKKTEQRVRGNTTTQNETEESSVESVESVTLAS
jgi:hypothetical protein